MRKQSVRGFTLVELMTVVGIAAILAMVAVPSFTKTIATQRLKAAASNLQSALLVARSEAIKRNTSICVTNTSSTCTPTGSTWNQGWYVLNSGTLMNTYPAYTNLTITGPTGSLTYQGSGRISGTPIQSGTNVYFKVQSSTISDVRCVNITTMGAPSITTTGC